MPADGVDGILVSCGSVNKKKLIMVILNGMYHNCAFKSLEALTY